MIIQTHAAVHNLIHVFLYFTLTAKVEPVATSKSIGRRCLTAPPAAGLGAPSAPPNAREELAGRDIGR